MSKMYVKNLGVNLKTTESHRRSSGRITRQQMLTLKALAAEKEKRSLFQIITAGIACLLSAVSLVTAKKANPMCQYYGHVIKTTTWSGDCPVCTDCHTPITDPCMLRKSGAVAAC